MQNIYFGTSSPGSSTQFYPRLLQYIADDAYLRSTLIMQGSGALYFYYEYNRSPSDLDFITERISMRQVRGLTERFGKTTPYQYRVDYGHDYFVIEYFSRSAERKIGCVEVCQRKNTGVTYSQHGIGVHSPETLLVAKVGSVCQQVSKKKMTPPQYWDHIQFLKRRISHFPDSKFFREELRTYEKQHGWDNCTGTAVLKLAEGRIPPSMLSSLEKMLKGV